MCGIVGYVYRDPSRPIDRARLSAMCDTIAHRGPDDQGFYVNGSAGLAARRLSIIDVAGGHQPMVNEDGSVAIAFNGEIYNHRPIRRELIARGHAFRSGCDTETTLHLCEEHGTDAPAQLRGMFAFAVWNSRSRELLLARDRFGIKPLYYAAGPWGIAFASELKAIVRGGFTSRELDRDALDMYLELGYIVAPFTPFTDVHKLPPGHTLRWRDGAVVVNRYWDLPHPSPGAVADPHHVRSLIDGSVAAHLASDVPVAAFLSGGLDSSSVVASMARASRAPHAYVARYHGSGAQRTDETGLAQALATRYGVKLTVVDIRPDVVSVFGRMVRALDEPLADDSAIPTWALAEAVARDYKVALTGIGGDELFGGYARHAGMLASEVYRRVPAPVRVHLSRAADALPHGRGHGVSRMKRFLAGGGGVDAGERLLAFVSRLRDDERERLYARDQRPPDTGASAALRAFRGFAYDARATHPLSAALYVEYKTFLADDVLALADRVSMAHGLELRVPLVDDVLVDHVFPLPAEAKTGWRQPKRLLRDAMRDRLPSAHFHAPKRGFVGPTGAWLRHELYPLLRDELAPDRMRRLGYFDPAVVTQLCDEHATLRQDREGILWGLLCFAAWHREFVEPAPHADAPLPWVSAATPAIASSPPQTAADRSTETPLRVRAAALR